MSGGHSAFLNTSHYKEGCFKCGNIFCQGDGPLIERLERKNPEDRSVLGAFKQ
jgi:hypothetical protein